MKNIEKKIFSFLKKKFNKKFSVKTNLISNELLDSISLIETVEFLENELNLKCPINKINKINFNSIHLMIKFLKNYN